MKTYSSLLPTVNFSLLVYFLIFLGVITPVFGQTANTVTIQWAPNSENDLAGYRVYQGVKPGQYRFSRDIGNTLSYTASNLDTSLTHYFCVTAYDNAGNESSPSAEISKTFNQVPGPTPTPNPNPNFGTGSSMLLAEDFAAGDLSRWQVVDTGTVSAPSSWAATTGALGQSRNIYGGSTSRSALPKPGTQMVYKGGEAWTDYTATVTLQSQDDDAVGVLVRYQDIENFYRFSWDSSRQYRRLVKAVKGVYTVLAEDAVPYVPGQAYRVELTVVGAQLTVRIDGEPVFAVTDESHSTGTMGLYSWGNQGSWFDDVQVQPPSYAILLAEDFAAGDLSRWQVVDTGTVSAPSSWAATTGALGQSRNIYGGSTSRSALPKPGTQMVYKGGEAWTDYTATVTLQSQDDDAVGVLVRYQDIENFYRFSWDSSRQYRRLVKAVKGVYTVLAEDAVPYVPGQAYRVELTVVGAQLTVRIDGEPVFAVTDESHSTGTMGLYSWGNQGSWFDDVQVQPPSYAILLAEDFAAGDLSRWQVVDTGTVSAPSSWAATTGALGQSRNIYGGSTSRSALPKPGTQMVYKGGEAWTDYTATVTLQSQDDDAVGVLVRYQDIENFYRFSWDSSRQYRRLVKAVKGVYTVLAEDAVPYVPGQAYRVELTVVGAQLTVRIDGEPVFAVTDESHSTGTMGLYSWGNQGSWFDDVQVIQAGFSFGN